MPQLSVSLPETKVGGEINARINPENTVAGGVAAGLQNVATGLTKMEERDAASYVTKNFSQFQIDEMNALADAKQSGDVDGFTQKYLEGYQTRMQTYLDKAPNQIGARLMEQRMDNWKDNITNKAITFEAAQRQADRLQGFAGTTDNYSKLAAQDPTQVPELFKQLEGDIIGLSGSVAPDKQDIAANTARKNISTSAMNATIYSNPKMFDKYADAGYFDDAFDKDPGKRGYYKELADKRAAAMDRENMATQTLNNINTTANLHYKLKDGKVSLSDIDAQPWDEQKKAQFKTALVEGDLESATTNNPVYLNLFNRKTEFDNGALGPKKLPELAKWLDDASTAIAEKNVRPSDVAPLVKEIQKTAVELAQADYAKNDDESRAADPNMGISMINQYLAKTKNENAGDRVEMYKNYMKFKDSANLDNIKDPTKKAQAMRELGQKVIDLYVRKNIPGASNYEVLPNSFITQSGEKIPVNPNPNNVPTSRSVASPVKQFKNSSGNVIDQYSDGTYYDRTTKKRYDKNGKDI